MHSQNLRNKGGFAAIYRQTSVDFPFRQFIERSLKTSHARALTICLPSAAASPSNILQYRKSTVELLADSMDQKWPIAACGTCVGGHGPAPSETAARWQMRCLSADSCSRRGVRLQEFTAAGGRQIVKVHACFVSCNFSELP